MIESSVTGSRRKIRGHPQRNISQTYKLKWGILVSDLGSPPLGSRPSPQLCPDGCGCFLQVCSDGAFGHFALVSAPYPDL